MHGAKKGHTERVTGIGSEGRGHTDASYKIGRSIHIEKNKTYLIVQDCYDDIYFDSDEEDNGGEGKKDKVNDTTNYL